jgi:hypothetical protein
VQGSHLLLKASDVRLNRPFPSVAIQRLLGNYRGDGGNERARQSQDWKIFNKGAVPPPRPAPRRPGHRGPWA